MSHSFDQTRTYARTLTRFAGSLSVAHCDEVAGDIGGEFTVDQVKMFTDGNLDKRFQKLQDQLELLSDDFDDLDDLIVEYVRSVPLAAYDTGRSDGDRFARWLMTSRNLTPEQRDILTVIRGRVAIEEQARAHRLAHVRFQERASVTGELLAELTTNPDLTLHVNPIRMHAAFESARFLGEGVVEPGLAVLFYAWRNEVRTCILEAESALMLRTLSDGEPCHLESLQNRLELTAEFDPELLHELISDCAEVGLIAFS